MGARSPGTEKDYEYLVEKAKKLPNLAPQDNDDHISFINFMRKMKDMKKDPTEDMFKYERDKPREYTGSNESSLSRVV